MVGEELGRVHGLVDEAHPERERGARADGGHQVHPTPPVALLALDPLEVAREHGQHQSEGRVGPALPDHQVGGQVRGAPALAQGGGVGADPEEQVGELPALVLGQVGQRRGPAQR